MSTYAGALAMVLILTQLTKNAPGISRLPTQLWSFLLALLVLFPARYFAGGMTLSDAALIPFNAALVSLAANGGYQAALTCAGKDGSSHSPARSEPAPSSPAQITGSPAEISDSPAQITGSPAEISGSPAQITGSPAQITGSPAQITDSPAQITDSPAQEGACGDG